MFWNIKGISPLGELGWEWEERGLSFPQHDANDRTKTRGMKCHCVNVWNLYKKEILKIKAYFKVIE